MTNECCGSCNESIGCVEDDCVVINYGCSSGAQGHQGVRGAQGYQGFQGSQGAQGFQGIAGTQGSQGDVGAQGFQGFQGDDGIDGSQGAQGFQGADGANGAQGAQGPQGDDGIDGAQGFQGDTGAQGFQGFQGPADGPQGPQGFQGFQGVQGSQGSQGFQGPQGVIGAQGVQGEQGAIGSQGDQGDVGSQGAQGFQGEIGAQGAQGFQGDVGSQGAQGFQGDVGPLPTGPANQLVYFDGAGDAVALPPSSVNSNLGVNWDYDIEPDNFIGGQTLNYSQFDFRPLQNSPDEIWFIHATNVNVDPDSSGFSFGTVNNAVTLHSENFAQTGTGDTGALIFRNMYLNIGNGTDPVDVKGFAYSFAFGNVNANANISGPIQGYIFQPNFQTGSTMSSSQYVTGLADFANIQATVPNYNSFTSAPTLLGVYNNNNFTAYSVNPNITDFFGNASGFGYVVGGNWGTFDTGFWGGINVNANVTSVANATGIYVNMQNVNASGTKRAGEFVGDVFIDGSLSFTGGLSIGQLQAFYATNPVDGGGNPLNMQQLTTGLTALNGTTTANGDAIGVNTAMLITMETNAVVTSGPFQLGFTALALPCVVETHTGSNLDYASGVTAAINLVGSSTGGTIQELRIFRSVPIPNGITTVNKSFGYYYSEPFGGVGTEAWGIYILDGQKNYLESPLKIGGADTPTNSDCRLELEGGAFLISRMDATTRNAMTAVNGMMIYNTDTDKFQGYAAGSWVDLN